MLSGNKAPVNHIHRLHGHALLQETAAPDFFKVFIRAAISPGHADTTNALTEVKSLQQFGQKVFIDYFRSLGKVNMILRRMFFLKLPVVPGLP